MFRRSRIAEETNLSKLGKSNVYVSCKACIELDATINKIFTMLLIPNIRTNFSIFINGVGGDVFIWADQNLDIYAKKLQNDEICLVIEFTDCEKSKVWCEPPKRKQILENNDWRLNEYYLNNWSKLYSTFHTQTRLSNMWNKDTRIHKY